MKPPKFTGIAFDSENFEYHAITEDGRIYEVRNRCCEANGFQDDWRWELVTRFEAPPSPPAPRFIPAENGVIL